MSGLKQSWPLLISFTRYNLIIQHETLRIGVLGDYYNESVELDMLYNSNHCWSRQPGAVAKGRLLALFLTSNRDHPQLYQPFWGDVHRAHAQVQTLDKHCFLSVALVPVYQCCSGMVKRWEIHLVREGASFSGKPSERSLLCWGRTTHSGLLR